MDWQIISAVGSLLCAAATFFAAFLALAMGRSEHKMSAGARGIFFEDDHFDLLEHHPNCFNIEIICDGNQPVYITHIFSKGQGLIKAFVGLKHGSNQKCVSLNAECRAEVFPI